MRSAEDEISHVVLDVCGSGKENNWTRLGGIEQGVCVDIEVVPPITLLLVESKDMEAAKERCS
jgi:hypothetical protein